MNIKKRLFIAIDLPDKIKQELFLFSKDFLEIPVKWIRKENLHITLLFLGYLPEGKIENLKKIIKKVCLKQTFFELELKKIDYFPIHPKVPKMIWVKIKKSDNLSILRNSLKKEIDKSKNENFSLKEKNDFVPHINLALISQWKLKQFNLDEIPNVKKELKLKINVNSIKLMESRLEKSGSKYITLENFNF